MKISIVGPTWPFRGGIAHYTTLLVKHLREAGHSVRFISYLKQYPQWLYPGNTAMDPSDDSSVLRIESDRVLTPLNPLTWWKAFRIMQQEKPDLVILQWWTPFFSPMLFMLTRLLRYYTKTKILFLCHHLIAPDGGVLDWFLAQRILRRGDAFVVMSEEDFALLRRALPRAYIKGTLHPPYDVFSREPLQKNDARAALSLNPDDRVVLFFGFVRRYKGLKSLIDALAIVNKELPTQLLVVGEFWEDERPYRAQIEALGLTDKVHLINGYVPNDQLSKYFSAADVVAMPYLEATQSGVAQLAIGFERPMIATRVGDMADVIEDGHNGLLVEANDPHALADAILHFYRDNLAPGYIEHIRRGKESSSWKPMVSLIEELAVSPQAISPAEQARLARAAAARNA